MTRQKTDLRSQYLICYNSVAWLLWALTGILLIRSQPGGLLSAGGPDAGRLWQDAPYFQTVFKLAQTLAILEVVHSATGLVRGHAFTAAAQVYSRQHILWLTWHLVSPKNAPLGFFMTCIAWILIELIRYPFYIATLLRQHRRPSMDENFMQELEPRSTWFGILRWLRYSAFIVLYPMGIVGEIYALIAALDLFKKTPHLRAFPYSMPNALNFELDLYRYHLLYIAIAVVGFFYLYNYMWAQRSRALASAHSTSKMDEEAAPKEKPASPRKEE